MIKHGVVVEVWNENPVKNALIGTTTLPLLQDAAALARVLGGKGEEVVLDLNKGGKLHMTIAITRKGSGSGGTSGGDAAAPPTTTTTAGERSQ